MKRSASISVILLACLMLVTLVPFLAQGAHAAAKITETVNISRPQKNMSGSGYYWDNRNDILTLDGLYIDTDDEFGLRIPENATVILKGKNYITASRAALTCPGSVNFKGSGSLILTSGDMGIYFYSTDDTTTARFLEGSFEITAGGDGICSEYTTLSFVGSKVEITAPAAESYAIRGRDVKLYGGKITADNGICATLSLDVLGQDLHVLAQKPALTAGKSLTLKEVSVSAGADADSLVKTDAYNGENCVQLKSTKNTLGTSVLFGAGVPGFVDVLVVLALVALIAAGIAAPFLRSYKKRKKALAAIAEAEAAETPNRQRSCSG